MHVSQGVPSGASYYFVTVTGDALAVFPAASQAVAVMVWLPADAFRVFQLHE